MTKIISLGSISFDVDKSKEFVNNNIMSNEGELARLYLNILPIPERTVKDFEGNNKTVPAQKGIDLESATAQEIINYLNDSTLKKSESIKSLCQRVLFIRFESKFNSETNKQQKEIKNEYNLIKLDNRKDINFLGEVGFNDTVHFNKKLNHNKKRTPVTIIGRKNE